jgi:hypothetical protein
MYCDPLDASGCQRLRQRSLTRAAKRPTQQCPRGSQTAPGHRQVLVWPEHAIPKNKRRPLGTEARVGPESVERPAKSLTIKGLQDRRRGPVWTTPGHVRATSGRRMAALGLQNRGTSPGLVAPRGGRPRLRRRPCAALTTGSSLRCPCSHRGPAAVGLSPFEGTFEPAHGKLWRSGTFPPRTDSRESARQRGCPPPRHGTRSYLHRRD